MVQVAICPDPLALPSMQNVPGALCWPCSDLTQATTSGGQVRQTPDPALGWNRRGHSCPPHTHSAPIRVSFNTFVPRGARARLYSNSLSIMRLCKSMVRCQADPVPAQPLTRLQITHYHAGPWFLYLQRHLCRCAHLRHCERDARGPSA